MEWDRKIKRCRLMKWLQMNEKMKEGYEEVSAQKRRRLGLLVLPRK